MKPLSCKKRKGEEISNLMLLVWGRERKWEEPYYLGSDSPSLLINISTHLASLFNSVSMVYSFVLNSWLIERNSSFVQLDLMWFESYALDLGYRFSSCVQRLKKEPEEDLQSFNIKNYERMTTTNKVISLTYRVWFNLDLYKSCFGVFLIYLGYRKSPREEVPVGWKYPATVIHSTSG